jgi:hypothetical protein
LSFAQFEREIIAERTRDKMAATRRKGKWSGGTPVLGYDLDPRGRRLHVNDEEATRVRAIFALYLEHQALLPVVQELARRGWVGKRWQTREGRPRGGRPFDKNSLYRLLTNVLYAGKVRYKDEFTTANNQRSSTPTPSDACRRCYAATDPKLVLPACNASAPCSRVCCVVFPATAP